MKKKQLFREVRIYLIAVTLLASCLIKVSGQSKGVSKVSEDLLFEVQKASKASIQYKLKASVSKPNLVKLDMLTRNSEGMLLIDAISDGDTKALEQELNKLGLRESIVYGRKVSGFFPLDKIIELEAIKNLVFVAPVYKPVLNSGAAYTNGDIALRSNLLRQNRGLEGQGIKVGVLSDSYDALKGASDGVMAGELPGVDNPNGYNAEVNVLEDIEDASDEGRAMCEIIHDIAPGSELAFHTAFLGQVSFAQGIILLEEAGCDVITDDVSYLNEPFFQDGIIAQAIDYVVKEQGVAYYSSAGNSDRDSYSSKFRSGGIYSVVNPYEGYVLGDYELHDFDPGEGVDIFQKVSLTPDSDLRLAFQWDEPFASVCEDCPGSKSDLDIFLCLSENADDVILQSVNYNIDADAWEILGASYSGDDTLSAYVCFGRWLDAPGENPNPKLVKYIQYGTASIDEYFSGSPTTMGHSNSKYGVGVGASAWFNTPAFGREPAAINYFSSVGGNRILFDTKGNRLRRPELRKSPLFTATDGGNTSFFGFQLNDGDVFPNFFGTSASAPHAAAISAQLLQMADGRVSTKQINYLLSKTALDLDDPYTSEFDYGYDFKTGYGLIQADLAGEELLKMVGIKTIIPYAECSDSPDEFRNWRIHNPNSFNVVVNWEVIGTNQVGVLTCIPGDSYVETVTRDYYNLLMISYSGPWGSPRKFAAFSPGESCNNFKSTEPSFASIDATPIVAGVYPNPFSQSLTLDIFSQSESSINVRLYNIQGQLVFDNKLNLDGNISTLKLDLPQLKNGMYIMNLIDKNGQLIDIIKLVKQE